MDLTKLLDMAHLLLHQQLELAAILAQTLFFCIRIFHLVHNAKLQLLQLDRLQSVDAGKCIAINDFQSEENQRQKQLTHRISFMTSSFAKIVRSSTEVILVTASL